MVAQASLSKHKQTHTSYISGLYHLNIATTDSLNNQIELHYYYIFIVLHAN